MKAVQSHQKSYADSGRRELVFDEGDFVFVKVQRALHGLEEKER